MNLVFSGLLRVFVLLTVLSVPALALLPCPRGLVDDSSPGSCGLYQDTDKDGYCDRSRQVDLKPRTAAAVVIQAASASRRPAQKHEYHQWLLLALMCGLVLLSELVSVLEPAWRQHLCLAWNWVLAASFMVCAASGLLFMVPGLLQSLPESDYSYYHVESGLVFIFAGVYHMIKRIRQFFPLCRSCR